MRERGMEIKCKTERLMIIRKRESNNTFLGFVCWSVSEGHGAYHSNHTIST